LIDLVCIIQNGNIPFEEIDEDPLARLEHCAKRWIRRASLQRNWGVLHGGYLTFVKTGRLSPDRSDRGHTKNWGCCDFEMLIIVSSDAVASAMLALFCSSLQIINQRICGLWRRETSIGHNDLMPVKRVDDGAFGNVAAFALSRDIGKRSLELLQINNFLPNAR